jgi:poly(A)-specific ribonuclease
MVFSSVVDIGHLWREIGPLRKAKNIQAALSYLQRQYFVPMEIEIPQQGTVPADTIYTSFCF